MESDETRPHSVRVTSPIGPGKRRRLGRLSDGKGRFSMIAIDQRTSLERMLDGRADEAETRRWIRLVKRIVTQSVAPLATAVLADPEYGYPYTLDVLPATAGLILALEVSGYTTANGHERRTRLLETFGVNEAAQAGCDAVKLLIYHHPDVSEATASHQRTIVREVGEACKDAGVPFILEIITYGMGIERSSEEFIRRKPGYVLDGIRAYGAPEFHVDLFKVQFPAELKHTREYQHRSFARGPAIFDRTDVEALCRELNEAAAAPWVILSGGVEPEEFLLNLELANRAGASGFLCGRAVWKDVVDLLPDEPSMRRLMQQEGARRFEAMRFANDAARPWFTHPRFSGQLVQSR